MTEHVSGGKRRKPTQRELEERLLADPICQVLLEDREYAARLFGRSDDE